MKKQYTLDIYFGIPGSGKTTLAAFFAKKAMKKKIPVYSNVPITGTYELDVHCDIGKNYIEDALVLIDEAGVEYNNRNFKNMPQHQIYFQVFRHYKSKLFSASLMMIWILRFEGLQLIFILLSVVCYHGLSLCAGSGAE